MLLAEERDDPDTVWTSVTVCSLWMRWSALTQLYKAREQREQSGVNFHTDREQQFKHVGFFFCLLLLLLSHGLCLHRMWMVLQRIYLFICFHFEFSRFNCVRIQASGDSFTQWHAVFASGWCFRWTVLIVSRCTVGYRADSWSFKAHLTMRVT